MSGCVMSAVTLPDVTYWPVPLETNENNSPPAEVKLAPSTKKGE